MSSLLFLSWYVKQSHRVMPVLLGLSLTLVLGAVLLCLLPSGSFLILILAMVLLSFTASVYNKFMVYTLCQYSSVKSRVSHIAFYNNSTVFIAALFPWCLNYMVNTYHHPMLVPEVFVVLSITVAIYMFFKVTHRSGFFIHASQHKP